MGENAAQYFTVLMNREMQPLVSEALFVARLRIILDGNEMPTTASSTMDCWELIVSEWLDQARTYYSQRIAQWLASGSEERAGKAKALFRDGFRCVISGHSHVNKPDQIHVHHIVPKSFHGPLRPRNVHSPRNLVSREVHERIHEEGWRRWAPKLFRAIGEEKAARAVEKTMGSYEETTGADEMSGVQGTDSGAVRAGMPSGSILRVPLRDDAGTGEEGET